MFTLGTSLRARPARETAAIAERLMCGLGISCVTDITALDVLGLPVFVSIRPGGKATCVHAGKGMTADDARAGALMEAVEFAVAERASAEAVTGCLPLGELAAGLPVGVSLADFAPRLDAVLQADRPTPAVRCVDLLSRRRTLLPAELALVPSPDDGMPPLFGWTSNGLASGNTLQEATLHALLEVLERDTVAMCMARAGAVFVDPETLPETFADRARRWWGLGVRLFVRHLPNEFGLPCFEATLHEPGHRHVELARGWGIHFDRTAALARAVCEAAQARLCQIHSAQPGMAALYGTRVNGDAAASSRAKDQFLANLGSLGGDAGGIDFRHLPHHEHRRIADALKALLAGLQSRHFRHVCRRRMGIGDEALLGLYIVKVIVAGCENIVGVGQRAGPRLIAQAAGAHENRSKQ